jgi:hypothetical protein
MDCPRVATVTAVDNSPDRSLEELVLSVGASYDYVNANIGYGRAHNRAIRRAITRARKYHLILNTDVQFDAHAVSQLAVFLDERPIVGAAMPRVLSTDGTDQYLCKLAPRPIDLISRFVMGRTSWTRNINARYEMRVCGYERSLNVPCLSGCFLLLRVEVLKEVGGFDDRFFMYGEDYDLSRRIHRAHETRYVPDITIRHAHARASHNGVRMGAVHVVNLMRYFMKWGWLFDRERREMNLRALAQ